MLLAAFLSALALFALVALLLARDRRRVGDTLPWRTYWREGHWLPAPYNVLVEASASHRGPVVPLSEFPGHERFEARWREIRDEAIDALHRAAPVAEFAPALFRRIGSTAWTSLPLTWYGARFDANLARCPVTASLLAGAPHVKAAMFSILAPGATIRAHRGPFRGCLRYHLGLAVPSDTARCAMAIAGETISWTPGEGRLFDDSFTHAVRNDTDEPRIVLFLDVMRPLRGLMGRANAALVDSPIPRWLSRLDHA